MVRKSLVAALLVCLSSVLLNAQTPGVAPGPFRLLTTATPYTLGCNDSWVNVTGTTTITVPHAACSAAANGARWTVFNSGTATVTLATDSGNINGAASILVAPNSGDSVTCDGTNCFAVSTTTLANCIAVGTAANPSVASCGAASQGMFSCATNASTTTCQVNTSAVTANSNIQIIQDAADGGASQLNVTCNTALVTPAAKPILLSKNPGVSFTINLGTVATNPGCFEYSIVN